MLDSKMAAVLNIIAYNFEIMADRKHFLRLTADFQDKGIQ